MPAALLRIRFRKNKRWVRLAQCRRTRQIVAYAIGRYEVMASWTYRSEATCRLLWERVPAVYKRGLLHTDFGSAYSEVLPVAQHRAEGKGAGQTCHSERFNGILRQRLARFVRRTLSFFKCEVMHEICLLLFLYQHNRRIQIILNN